MAAATPQLDAESLAFLGRLARREQRRGGGLRKRQRHQLQAAYDAAQTNELNKKYWGNVDSLSANEANSPEVRKTLRERARYECHEANPLLKGVVHTLANDVIGTGPKLQMQLPDQALNREIERHFHAWCRETRLAKKLRTLRIARLVDGEGFAQLITNRRLRHLVQIDLRVFEADRCASPWSLWDRENEVDGIRFDEAGNPLEYLRLRTHPGGPEGGSQEVETIAAERIIHLFRQDRAEQYRGIPEITTALPLAALLRDYILAVLHNVRTNAKFTAIMQTKAAAVTETGDSYDRDVIPYDFQDIDYDMLTALPAGWEMKQFQSSHPMATFDMFVREITRMLGRCLLLPYGITAADSSGYNYSSGRLDHQQYNHAIRVDRHEIELECLDRVLEQWFDEAMLAGLIPAELGARIEYLPHMWFWDSRGHADPLKEANAQAVALKSGTSHRASAYAALGKDLDVEDELAAAGYGVDVPTYRRALFLSQFAQQGQPLDAPDPAADSEAEPAQTLDEEE